MIAPIVAPLPFDVAITLQQTRGLYSSRRGARQLAEWVCQGVAGCGRVCYRVWCASRTEMCTSCLCVLRAASIVPLR